MTLLKMSLLTVFHPSTLFNYLQKDRERNNFIPAAILLLLVIAARVFTIYMTHFPMPVVDPRDANILLEIAKMLIPILSWAIAVYAVTSITDGETTFSEAVLATAFAMVPYIVLSIPFALISHLFETSMKSFYIFLQVIMWIWVGVLVLKSVKVMNHFTFGKIIIICLISIFTLAVLWAVAILFFALSGQLVRFFQDLFLEFKMKFVD